MIFSIFPKKKISDVKSSVKNIRDGLYQRIRGLDEMAFDLEIHTQELQKYVDIVTHHLRKWEPIRYFSTIGKKWSGFHLGKTCFFGTISQKS